MEKTKDLQTVVAEASDNLYRRLNDYQKAYDDRLSAIQQETEGLKKEIAGIDERLAEAIDKADTSTMMALTTEKSAKEATLKLLDESLKKAAGAPVFPEGALKKAYTDFVGEIRPAFIKDKDEALKIINELSDRLNSLIDVSISVKDIKHRTGANNENLEEEAFLIESDSREKLKDVKIGFLASRAQGFANILSCLEERI